MLLHNLGKLKMQIFLVCI